jgi:hypothetical protein
MNLIERAMVAEQQHQQLLTETYAKWHDMFGEDTQAVLESVNKILGAVQSRMSAGKDPYQLVPGKEQQLINLVAGVKSLRDAGPGVSGKTLAAYVQRVQQIKQGIQPDQAQVAAIQAVGKKNQQANASIKQAFDGFAAAIQQHDQQHIQTLKQQFSQLYSFYQQMANQNQQQASPSQQRTQNNIERPSVTAGNNPRQQAPEQQPMLNQQRSPQ